MKSKVQAALLVIGMMLAFTVGRTLAAEVLITNLRVPTEFPAAYRLQEHATSMAVVLVIWSMELVAPVEEPITHVLRT